MFVSGSSTWGHGEMLWQCYSHVWTIRWWPVVGGASGHSCSEDRSLFSLKGYRMDRRLKASGGSKMMKGKRGKVHYSGFTFVNTLLNIILLILFK